MESSDLEFRDGVPWSARFDDLYFSAEGGFAETRHVFLEGNGLPRRFAAGGAFTVGELGFGTGANALACARLWLDHGLRVGSRDVGVLHYLTFERFPVDAPSVLAVAEAEPSVADLAEELADALPPAVEGLHRAVLARGHVVVTWVLGDARVWLPRLAEGRGLGTGVDAWFLDGFAPSRNPELWEPDLLAAVARASGEGATFATYTVAGAVRRALEAAGFAIERRPGFGTKREMLAGALRPGHGRPAPIRLDRHGADSSRREQRPAISFREEPWRAAPLPPIARDEASDRAAVVVGGGLAGTVVACRLAEAGLRVTLLERERTLASGASANPSAVLMPVVTAEGDVIEPVSFAGFELALRRIRRLEVELGGELGGELDVDSETAGDRGPPSGPPLFERCGVLHLPRSDRFARRFEASALRRQDPPEVSRLITPEGASRRAGVPLETGGIWYERGGVVDLRRLCDALVASAGDRVRVEATREVLAISHEPDWKVVSVGADGKRRVDTAPVVVHAGGFDLAGLPGAEALPVRPIRGQIAWASATESIGLRCVVCRDGYLLPERGAGGAGRYHVGATYDRVDLETSGGPRDGESRALVERIRAWSPAFAGLAAEPGEGWTAVRAQTPDRLPIAGAMPDVGFFRKAYSDIHHARAWQDYPVARYQPGLYASVGHGSRGAVTTFVAAEIIASLVTGAPMPLTDELLDALAPARFLLRDLKRSPAARLLELPPL